MEEVEQRAWLFMAIVAFAMVVLWNAWIGDDAFITFRTVDNFVNGYGLRWNVAERVQSYTNPLWLLLFTVPYAVTREPYYTAVALSVAVSCAAVVVATCVAHRSALATWGVGVFCVSKAFVDYSTSGLENPLTHLLLGLFVWQAFRMASAPSCGDNQSDDDGTAVMPTGDVSRRGAARLDAFLLSFLAASTMVNRMDTALLTLPCVMYLFVKRRTWSSFFAMAGGTTPILAWMAFALIYYGFFFPNTAYAKLNQGWPAGELLVQGLRFHLDSLRCDPVTWTVIATTVVSLIWDRRPVRVALASGLVLYLGYVTKIGGDFMSGRMLTPVLFVAVLLLIESRRLSLLWKRRWVVGGAGALLLVGVLNPWGPIANYPFWKSSLPSKQHIELTFNSDTGIADERAFYFPSCGLARRPWLDRLPDLANRRSGEYFAAQAKERGETSIIPGDVIGILAFYAGPHVHVVDVHGLSDAYVARLPPRKPKQRIGHIERELTKRYFASLISGENSLVDPARRQLLTDIVLITRRPLFDRDRWRAIWKANVHGLMPRGKSGRD